MAKVWVFVQQEGGATAIEYGIIASMIFVVILGAVTLFGVRVTSMWTVVATHV
ncbi:MAG TPA: Flp family type IVb pilin [Deltaproteobacteria bacterium]|nr:Flp family type IVb pilin [Deltaproteobacteria bacterium]